ncbi:MAG: imelysin family protein [Myxococcota bacterium]
MVERRHIPLVLAAALALTATLGACDSDSDDDADDDPTPEIEFDRAAMLSNIGENVLLPVYRDFDSKADELAGAVTAYCEALGDADEQSTLDTARTAWSQTMSAWQQAEMMLFGPAAMDANALRERIYSWPVVSSCAVDQDVVLRRDDPAAYEITSRLTNRRGLDALEYILFADSMETSCPAQSAPEGWDALTEAEKREARCAFAIDAAADLGAAAQIAVDAWAPEAGDYLSEFANAGQPGSSFDRAQIAINVVSDAIFYSDVFVKDMKLGQPAGIVMNRCATIQEPCPDELESQFAPHTKENIQANLRGLGMLFTGAGPDNRDDGPSFEDYLRAAGADELADSMVGDIIAAESAAEAISGSLSDALTADYDSVVTAHSAVKAFTDNLKSQFLTVLGLDIPQDAATDND